MKRIATALPDVCLIEPIVFRDDRGFFFESYQDKKFADLGICDHFVQDNHSCSLKGTLRGLHYQVARPQAKLCRVVHGEVLDVVVDLRRGSPNFGQHITAVLSAENQLMIYVPAGFAHGYLVLSETAEFLYKCSDYYAPQDERGLIWNDSGVGIHWGIDQPLLSAKDRTHPALAAIPPEELPALSGLPYRCDVER
jgi:dTDP-4-dehydrorhamnose 3,5-epimerase